MQFTQSQTSSGLVISMQGSFTFKDHQVFRAVLDVLTASDANQQILDLSQVDFLDSAALGMLLIADDEATKARRKLKLRNPSVQIMRLFELSAMDAVFQIERSAA
jgi:HptB-dependent secretion and biofilm anti anti-sigma factor